MKKLMTVCSMLCLFMLGVHSAQAQMSAEDLQQNVENQALELRKIFNLNESQTKQLYSAIYKREKTLNFTDYSGMTKQELIDFNSKVNDEFKQNLTGVLTEEQFKKYAEWLEKKKNTSKE